MEEGLSFNVDYRSLFRNSPDLYLILTPDLIIVESSEQYLLATLTRRNEIVGRHLFEVFPDNPDDALADGVQNLRNSLMRVLEIRQADTMPRQKYDIRLPAESGGGFEERWWSPVNTPILDEEGNVTLIVHKVTDVTELVKLERQQEETKQTAYDLLQEKNRELEVSNAELDSFCYSISHDLRAPLRAISGCAQIVLDDHRHEIDASAQRMMKAVVDNAAKMGQLIDDLLAFSRLGRRDVSATEVNIADLARAVLEEVKNSTPNVKAVFTIADLPPARADAGMLKQVFANLFSNAIKYSALKDAPAIEAGFYEQEEQVVYFIKDNGAGFDMRYYDKLFGVFQRLHNMSDFEGTGVGLALVKRIVNKHGGTIWAEGKTGEGAAFYFTLSAPTKNSLYE